MRVRSNTFTRCAVLCLLIAAGATVVRAQGSPGLRVAPAGGLTVYLGEEGRRSLASTFGANARAGLTPTADVEVGYRSLDVPGEGNLHLGSLALLRTLDLGTLPSFTLSAGGTVGRARHDAGWSYGPRVGIAAALPLGRGVEFDLTTAFGGVSRNSEQSPERGFEGFLEATAGLRVRLGRPACTSPTLASLEVPTRLMPYEAGSFAVRGSGEAHVAWTFGDGVVIEGAVVARTFTKSGAVAYRVLVEGCGEVAVLEGLVEVAPPCWMPPSVEVVAFPRAIVAPSVPVTLVARAQGTPPLRYRWRHIAGVDTISSLTVAYGQPGAYEVSVEVTNCTGQTATAKGVVLVESFQPVIVAFGHGRCDAQSRPGDKDATNLGDVFTDSVLLDLAARLSRDTTQVLLIEGFANEAPASFNNALSWGRADTVAAYLREAMAEVGIDLSHRILAVGRGVGPEEPQRWAIVSLLRDRDLNAHWVERTGPPVPPGRACPSSVTDLHWTTRIRD